MDLCWVHRIFTNLTSKLMMFLSVAQKVVKVKAEVKRDFKADSKEGSKLLHTEGGEQNLNRHTEGQNCTTQQEGGEQTTG